MGSVQFYGKFIPNLASMAEPLYRLTKKATPWKWEDEEQATFEQLKNVLSSDQVLVHFDQNKTLMLACDESNVGIGAVLVHRYPDGSERPIANMSKTLTAAERNYSQIHKEALSIIYGLKKFYQYLYGRPFMLVTDHKPLTALFGPKKGTPLLAANRLARWALWLNLFDYTLSTGKQRITAMQMPSVACHLEMTSASTGRKVVKTWTWCMPSKFSVFKSNLRMPTSFVKSLKRIL